MLLKFGILLLVASVLVGEFVRQYRVRRERKLREFRGPSGMTGEEIARKILAAEGIEDVEVVESSHLLTNHFLPARKLIRLAPENFRGSNAAALGVAVHVTGHALQDRAEHRPLQWRETAIHLTCWGTVLSFLLLLPLLVFSPRIGILALGFAWAFIRGNNLLTLPVEMDASGRAKDVLWNARILGAGKEFDAVEEMLPAAALDKVSGFLSFWHFLFRVIFPWKPK